MPTILPISEHLEKLLAMREDTKLKKRVRNKAPLPFTLDPTKAEPEHQAENACLDLPKTSLATDLKRMREWFGEKSTLRAESEAAFRRWSDAKFGPIGNVAAFADEDAALVNAEGE